MTPSWCVVHMLLYVFLREERFSRSGLTSVQSLRQNLFLNSILIWLASQRDPGSCHEDFYVLFISFINLHVGVNLLWSS